MATHCTNKQNSTLLGKVSQSLPEWVEYGFAIGPAAQYGLVLDGRQVRSLFERSVKAGHGNHKPCGLQAAGRPEVPAAAYSITILVLLDELLVGRHDSVNNCERPARAK